MSEALPLIAIGDVACDLNALSGCDGGGVARYVIYRPHPWRPLTVCPACARSVQDTMRANGDSGWRIETLEVIQGTVIDMKLVHGREVV